MKKIVQALLVVCMVVFSAQVAFANSDKVTVPEGADLTSVHRLAIGMPRYVPVGKDDPTKEQLATIIYDASKVARSYVMSYDEAANNIQKDSKVDIKSLDRRKAAEAFKKGVGKYVDAYVIVTVANNSRTTFFFDVYKVGTDECLYTYEIQANSSEKDNAETFTNLSDQFYKHFERSAEEQVKAKVKADKKK